MEALLDIQPIRIPRPKLLNPVLIVRSTGVSSASSLQSLDLSHLPSANHQLYSPITSPQSTGQSIVSS